MGKHNEDEGQHASISLSLFSRNTYGVTSVVSQSRFVIATTEIYSRSDRDYDFGDRTTRQVGGGVVEEENKIKSNIRGELRLQLRFFQPPATPSNWMLCGFILTKSRMRGRHYEGDN